MVSGCGDLPAAHTTVGAAGSELPGPGLVCMAYMRRTTIELDDSLDARVRREAARCGMTISEWTREAIVAHLPGAGELRQARRRFRSAGAGDSGRSDIAERMEEILAGLAEGRDILAEEEGGHRDERLSA
jgi:hypothetical protein